MSDGSDGNNVSNPVNPYPAGSPLNPDGTTPYGPTTATWKGGQRPNQWTPPDFLQTYGNYTGMFPSMGQQVGQALYGSIQAQPSMPAWAQSVLPPMQHSTFNMANYAPGLLQGTREVGNTYPLNGTVNLQPQKIGYVSNAGNPFIGAYQGLTGYPGNGPATGSPGTGTTQPPATQPPASPPPGTNPNLPNLPTQPVAGGTKPGAIPNFNPFTQQGLPQGGMQPSPFGMGSSNALGAPPQNWSPNFTPQQGGFSPTAGSPPSPNPLQMPSAGGYPGSPNPTTPQPNPVLQGMPGGQMGNPFAALQQMSPQQMQQFAQQISPQQMQGLLGLIQGGR